jgi:hypothetical protein
MLMESSYRLRLEEGIRRCSQKTTAEKTVLQVEPHLVKEMECFFSFPWAGR